MKGIFKDKYGKFLTFGEAIPKIKNRIANYFLDFELCFLTFVGYCHFHSIRRFFYRVSGLKIGQGSTIHMWARFYQPKNISIAEDTIIGDHALLDGRAKLTIGSHTDIASEVMIYNSEHDLAKDDFSAIEAEVKIGDYCFIGPRAIILPGVVVGRGSVVAAGAVVTKDVPDYAMVGGVPAKVIGERPNKNLSYKLGRARLLQ